MPPHNGHLALIAFALKRCDFLYLCVCTNKDEPIAGRLRYHWLKALIPKNKKINVIHVKAKLPRDKAPTPTASRIWAAYFKKRIGEVDVLFTSEKFGDVMAKYLSCHHIIFDHERKLFPVSATEIRKNPLKNTVHLPEIIKNHFKEVI